MKKSASTVLFIFFLIPVILPAQNYLGLKGGLLCPLPVGYVHDKYSNTEIQFKKSFTFSLTYRSQVTRVFSVGTNIGYNFYTVDLERSWYNPMGGGGRKNVEYTFGYAGIFLYPQFNFGNKVSFFFNAGPGVLFLTNSYEKGEVTSGKYLGDVPVTKIIDGKAGDDLNHTLVVLMSTVGLQFKVSEKIAVTTDAVMIFGPDLLETGNYKNQMDFSFSVGLLYILKESKSK